MHMLGQAKPRNSVNLLRFSLRLATVDGQSNKHGPNQHGLQVSGKRAFVLGNRFPGCIPHAQQEKAEVCTAGEKADSTKNKKAS
jgi:hypothetical protein